MNLNATGPQLNGAALVLLYSVKWSRGESYWWAPNQKGYTRCLGLAGWYTPEEANEIMLATHGDAIPITQEELASLYQITLVDEGMEGNHAKLKAIHTRNMKIVKEAGR